MSNCRHCILTCLLLTLVSLTSAAQNIHLQRGCRRGTPRPAAHQLRRGASQGRTPGGDYYHGEKHQLVVLVAYHDRAFKGDEAETLEQWDKIFNAEHFSEAPFKGSVHDYYMAQSYDDFSVFFDLVYVKVGGNAAKYASTAADDENSQYLVQDIIDTLLKTRDDIDWSRYDWNGDGKVNQLLIVFAGKGSSYGGFGGGTDAIWPHQWWMSEHLKDRKPGVYCEPIPVTAGGKQYLVDCYCAVMELYSDNTYKSFGTICHEYTHCFGFPDFYGPNSYGNTVSYVYEWDLMDAGNCSGSGFQPTGYSAHERWLMGWLTPIELTGQTVVTDMPALADEGRAYLIRNDGHAAEYYIVENRQPTGWDASLPGSGLLVFHIDYDPTLWTSVTDWVNKYDAQHYMLFHANNKSYSIGNWAYPYGGNDDLTNTSTPAATLNNANSDGTLLMNKPLTQMAVTNGLASFRFMDDPSAVGQPATAASAAPQPIYRMGPITFLRYADGTVRKQIR